MTRAGRRRLAVVPILALVAACQSAAPSGSPGSGTPGASGPGISVAPGASGVGETGAPSLPPDIVIGTGELVLADPGSGLDTLPSHHSVLIISFDGTAAGAPAKWTTTVRLSAASSPRVMVGEIERAGVPADGPFVDEPSWAAEVDGVAYRLVSGGSCAAASAGTASLAITEPATVLPSVVGAVAAGAGVKNGISSNLYTIDRLALGILVDAQASGQLAIAIDGDYITSYALTTTAGPDYFGDGISGTMTMSYELSDVGAPVTVDMPANCPTGKIELALPTDATNVLSVPGMLTYMTQASLKNAAGTVSATALLAHWQHVGTDVMGATFGGMQYEFEGIHLDVLVSTETGGTYVQVVGSRPQT